jgi:hypothetical protein
MVEPEKEIRYFSYVAVASFKQSIFIKIGRTQSLSNRLSAIQTGCPHKIQRIFVVSSEYHEDVIGLENLLHYLLKPYNTIGEWFGGDEDFLDVFKSCFFGIMTGSANFTETEEIAEHVSMEAFEVLLHGGDYTLYELKLPLNRKDVFEGAELVSLENFQEEIKLDEVVRTL